MVNLSFFEQNPTVPQTQLRSDFLDKHKITLTVIREDCIDKEVSGNKFRKLKYNFKEAIKGNYKSILTFGGAYSNHIAAVAKAGNICNIPTIGVIRGEELGKNLKHTLLKNTTLAKAKEYGMQFKFISREQYRAKNDQNFLQQLKNEFPQAYIIPEGGTNQLAVKGCQEILPKENKADFICASVGTGGTLAGLCNSSNPLQKVIGFPALKGTFVSAEIGTWTRKNNWELVTSYHFGGYGKVTDELITFMNAFYKAYGILLDPIYTGKLFYGIFDMIRNGYFKKNTRIFAIHTGGLQGIVAMNQKLAAKNKPLILTQSE
ncbi:1-aminocyclopropane-1-carboxylate deaminase/D-cysteine desulfhydrase [Aquimarina sp. ERC-38]|uniref:1-aminocyclopropane-1-carboxylate deaminase/D-cysteine desulfhydrase n=1 Tax=Aquimarina sp. ERC-38 TaxID=2949996 RepID=UPI003A598D06